MRSASIFMAAAIATIACGAVSDSRLVGHDLDSKILGHNLPFSVLEPPACPEGVEDNRDLHLVYLLHGYGGDSRSLDREGLSDRLFIAQAEARIPHVVIVAPTGEHGFYMNWHDGSLRYEDYLVREVIPQAEETLGMEIDRSRRHLVGVSMGGHGALLLGLKHPDMFESVASISGSLFDRRKAVELAGKRFLDWTIDIKRMLGDGSDHEFLDANNPYNLVESLSPETRPRIFLSMGTKEPESLRMATTRYHDFLVEKGIDHEWAPFDGSHNWESWAPVIEKAIAHATGFAPKTP